MIIFNTIINKKALDRYSITYLLLSFLSGFLELGIILYALRENMPLIIIPILGIAYQSGALFRRPIELPSWHYLAATASGLVIGLIIDRSIGLLIITIFLLSIGLQGSRELVLKKRYVGTFAKRISRVLGFAFSGVFDLHFLLAVAVIGLIVMLVMRKDLIGVPGPSFQRNWYAGVLGRTMLIHQAHYFSYAYFIPFLFLNMSGVSISLVGIVFSIGWISYSIAPLIFPKKSLIQYFSLGHLLASLTLFTIFSFSNNFWIVLGAWFFSGFGGGTVFYLREMEHSISEKTDLELWENFGHIFGLIVSITIIGISGQPTNLFIIGGTIAVLTALFLPISMWMKFSTEI